MTAHTDRRLIDQIKAAGQSGQVEAIIVVRDSAAPHLAEDDAGLARQVVDSVIESTGCRPNSVRYFPRANAAILAVSGRFLQEILNDWRVTVASATDTDLFGFPDA